MRIPGDCSGGVCAATMKGGENRGESDEDRLV